MDTGFAPLLPCRQVVLQIIVNSAQLFAIVAGLPIGIGGRHGSEKDLACMMISAEGDASIRYSYINTHAQHHTSFR